MKTITKFRKALISTLAFLLICTYIFAQSPQKMSYQAVIRNSSNNLVTNATVGMRISILQGSATGTVVYTETQTPTTNANGLISIEFGGGTKFSSIDWSTGSYFIQTETDPTGGNNYTITGTNQLLSVPYALYAKKAENEFSGNYNDLSNKPTIPPVQINSDWNATSGLSQIQNKPNFAIVATSGSYNDLSNKPLFKISKIGDTLYITKGQSIIIPGISAANIPSTIPPKVDSSKIGNITDIDGNKYKTLAIGTQIWMIENLRVTKYNDGSTIQNVTDNTEWDKLSTGAVCSYNNTISSDTINTFGRLYNWYAVNTIKLCPSGWHVPSDTEWSILQNYLIVNGYNYDYLLGDTTNNNIAKAMASTTGWFSSANFGSIGNNLSTNNTSGFTALPGGNRYSGFNNIGYIGYWWSSTQIDISHTSFWNLYGSASNLSHSSYNVNKSVGYSVRCLRN